MKLIFNINYHTNWGESLFIVIDAEMPDAKDRNLELTMTIGLSAWSFLMI